MKPTVSLQPTTSMKPTATVKVPSPTAADNGRLCDSSSWKDEDGKCLAGDLRSPSKFAPKDWYEATNVCANQGKVLCGVDEPCKGKGCLYDREYQWTGEECQAGDAGLPAACASA